MPVTEHESRTLGDPAVAPRSERRPQIALYGVFGVQNIGNEYTLQAMLYNVRQTVPAAEVFGICYDPEDTERLHGLPALRIKCTSLARHFPPARNLLVKLFRGLFRRIPLELYDWLRAFRVLRRTDLMIVTGTGLLTDYCGSGLLYDMFKWSLAAKLARCKVRFVGVGVGPIYRGLSRICIKAALALADYRGYRDDQSKARLKQNGFERPNDSVFPDLAFSLPPSALPPSRDPVTGKRVVGLGVMKFIDIHKGKRADCDEAYDRYLTTMCDFAIWLLKHGYTVRVLEGDLRYDPPVRVDIKARLEQRGITYGVDDITGPPITSPENLLEHLSATDIIISPRFHNLVLGIMMQKPVISVTYDPKNDSLLESFGLGEYRQSIENVDLQRLIAQFVQLESRADQVRVTLRQRTEEYRSLLNEQYRQVLREFA